MVMMMIPKYLFWHSKKISDCQLDPPRELLQLGEHFTQALDRLHNFAAEFEAEFTAEMWLAQVAPCCTWCVTSQSVFQELAIFVKQSLCHESC